MGRFGAERGSVQQGSGESSGESFRGVMVQSQVKFNRNPEKVWEVLAHERGPVQQGSGKGCGNQTGPRSSHLGKRS